MPYMNQNPNYYNQYMNQNPYLQRMENLQQFQQTLNPVPMQNQFPALGKMVESIDMVKATDIPMDGNMYYFPTADGNLVFGKQWLPTGQTRILTFKPVLDDNPNTSSQNEEKLNFYIIRRRVVRLIF